MNHGLGQNLDIDQRRNRLQARIHQCSLQLFNGVHFVSLAAIGRRAHGEIHRHKAAIELAGFRVAEAELGAEAVHAVAHLQVVDAAEGHVVEQHYVDLAPLLNRGRQFRVQHHVGAVAHQCIDLALRLGEFHAQCGVDLVTHARISVLDVVGVHALAAPAALQVAGQAAGGGDDH
ncbi:hypothetical protein D3C73_1204550 [compost metagenome]